MICVQTLYLANSRLSNQIITGVHAMELYIMVVENKLPIHSEH